MSKGKADYPYPEDEFDAPADPDGPHGVHRVPRSARSRWAPFIVVLVVVPVLTFAAVYVATQRDQVMGLLGLGQGSAKPAATSSAAAEPDADAEPEPSDPADAPQEPPAAEPVLTTSVLVLNAAGIKGLAADAQTRLTGVGFTTVGVDNTTKGQLTASTVYYASADLEATAQLVASTLGLSAVELDPTATGVRVVLIEKLSV